MRKSGSVPCTESQANDITQENSILYSNLLLYGYDRPAIPRKGSKENQADEALSDGINTKMATGNDCFGNDETNSKTLAHLNLSETQLNALSYSLSELAEKISPTKNEFVDEVEWELKAEGLGIDRKSSVNRNKGYAEQPNSRTKTPYTKTTKFGSKHPLSKRKSFTKDKQLLVSTNGKNIQENSLSVNKVSHQESVESGYNSSWSSNSFNEDKSNADTDIEEESVFSDTIADKYDAQALETKISDVEKRINSLIFGRKANELSTPDIKALSEIKAQENTEIKESRSSNNEKLQNEPLSDQNGDIVKSPGLPNGESDFKKSPFQVRKVRKTSIEDTTTHAQKSTRPGLVRRRTTLVTFRPPRNTSAFNEVDDSGILEIDEAGFVQCLTDVRAMKTMLLKLKRELQEAEVQSPLSRSLSARSTANLANSSSLNETADEETRRHTYDSSETIHEKLQRIRSKFMSRRNHSSCAESPLEDVSTAEQSNCADSREVTSDAGYSNEVIKMKEELDDLKTRMKELKQERDTLFMDKEEMEHELAAKNSTIKMLQKQLETQDNNDEVTCLKRQVTALTQQVRQQQQKIAELKYHATSPRRDSAKLDIKHRLRDAFTRHLEESSKSHMLLSKHIEKAEFTVSEAQKGLKSLFVTSSHEDGEPSNNKQSRPTSAHGASRNSLGTPSLSEEKSRRHSWTINSIDRIIKTWKDTTQSIENIAGKSPKSNKKSSKLPKPSSPHMSFL